MLFHSLVLFLYGETVFAVVHIVEGQLGRRLLLLELARLGVLRGPVFGGQNT